MTRNDYIAFIEKCNPKYKGHLIANMTGLAEIFGMSKTKMRECIKIHSIPWYTPVREKMYIIPEVLDYILSTRWGGEKQ